jgi:protein-S-isoprenylcysteine O-methyltransferase Ste14
VLKWFLFAVASVPIILYSWPSLQHWRTHGFFRFFAFESILGLVLLNADHWFRDPFSAPHILSWLLLGTSLYFVIQGFYLLRRVGQPTGDFENTTNLVSVGIYRYIRHPLYSSLLLLAWGVFFKNPSDWGACLVIAASVALYAAARVEEDENIDRFGDDYVEYMGRTKRFLPFMF